MHFIKIIILAIVVEVLSCFGFDSSGPDPVSDLSAVVEKPEIRADSTTTVTIVTTPSEEDQDVNFLME
jgi:hypothetical protein